MQTWETVIGLEVHAQLQTNTKIFSGASTDYGALPNTQACAIDLGLPGVLPVLNKEAVRMAIKFGLAIGAKLNMRSIFARKNYFYPDLPKGYQISQFELPIVGEGALPVLMDDKIRNVEIVRAHLEEDAGKSLHEEFSGHSGIDLNRAGTPLLEIVSAPVLNSAQEAVAYLKALHTLVRYLEICDGNMQEGSFRCDANVSVRRPGAPLGTRCEIKNVNSFRFVERAIEYEVERQIAVLGSGGTILQQTRLYDSVKNETRALRSKEEANDYRYFPDPDLLPLVLTDVMIEEVRKTLPELPQHKLERYQTSFGLSLYDAQVLTSSQALAHYFETVLKAIGDQHAKLATNWICGDLLGFLNKANLEIEQSPISEALLAQLLKRVVDGTLSGKTGKQLFEILWEKQEDGLDMDAIIAKRGLKQMTDTSQIEKWIDEIIANNPGQVAEYKSGKDKLFGFFVGQVMKISKGVASPEQVNELLKKKLSD